MVEILRKFRKEQQAIRRKLRAGKLLDDALLLAGVDGALPSSEALQQGVERL